MSAPAGRRAERGGAPLVLVLLVLAVPTAGASCVPLWILADRECSRAQTSGAVPPADAVLLRDVGCAGTAVFGVVAGLVALLAAA